MATPITNIEDLRVLARRRVPKALFEYVDGGSYDELTLRANRADLDAVKLRQRVLVDTSQRDLTTALLGETGRHRPDGTDRPHPRGRRNPSRTRS